MSEPITDADLAYQRWSRNDLLSRIHRLEEERDQLRADRDELEDSYYHLLSRIHWLEEERDQLRVKRTAMLDALEAAQVVADLDTWSWEDRQGALREWDERIARVRNLIGDDDE